MADTVPADSVFEAGFSEARVSQVPLARYYLRALEQKIRNQDNPELEPIDDETIVNLEHILPVNPEDNWPQIEREVAAAYYKRLGNMVLMNAKQNSTAVSFLTTMTQGVSHDHDPGSRGQVVG